MAFTPAFPALLNQIDEHSAMLRHAIATAPDPHATVPSCPDWQLPDLLAHLTVVQRFWTAAVTAGPGFVPIRIKPDTDLSPEQALAASAEATSALLKALREAGPRRPCWTWWQEADAPQDTGAAARHQVQEAAVHAYDAQLAVGTPQPVAPAVAIDGIDEFLALSWGTATDWQHGPARIRLRTDDGPSWLAEITASGPKRLAPDEDPVALELTAPASELLLTLHRRHPPTAVRVTGDDPTLLPHLLIWPRLG
ncbi:maleylpyruvate isomerase N-terminal domain-containing protein [Kitasatospora sp. NPDC051984]|uniref:maleylpyruvate isomerase N-terminal domain-containing protein n=1 Tax=Kitasatospora sp. NPDC051984 TaxID=3364059 RepID=UPI0037CB6309